MHSHGIHSRIQSKSRKRKSFKEDTVVPEKRGRTVRDSNQESSELDTEKDSCTQSMRERADIQDYA